MRRRDPDCMVIGDDKATDKPKYIDRFGKKFKSVRKETLNWLKEQELIVMPFMSGGDQYGYESLLICPKNAAFFACGLADMQGKNHFPGAIDLRGTDAPPLLSDAALHLPTAANAG